MKFHPAVPRHWLYGFAGIVWFGVGLLLCLRTVAWIALFEPETGILVEAAGLLIAIAGYVYGFSKIVDWNIERIRALPDRVCAFAFTAWRGYLMIGLMVAIGLTLRSSSMPKQYLVLPYTAMGIMLLIGSQRLLRTFLAEAYARQ